MSIIYLLSDPRTRKIRYVGQTSKTLERRLRTHLHSAPHRKTHVSRWITSLLTEGVVPEIHAVEQGIEDPDVLDALEKAWIIYGREYGWDLTNNAAGGRVNRGFRATEETRAKLREAHLGKTMSTETRQRMSAAQAGHTRHTPETRAAVSAVHKGKVVSQETREKMRQAAILRDPATRYKGGRPAGYKHTEESRQRMREGIARAKERRDEGQV
jgi:hypothetical protein